MYKRDINRGYRNTLENQSFIKGKIDFIENIKKNSFRKHLHAVRYEEFTEDILLNQILKTVISQLVKRTKVRENRMKLRQALLWLEDVETVRISQNIWGQVRFTRLNNQYKPLLNMARLFYSNSSLSLNKGDELCFSFLVPLNRLFEKYLYELIKNTAPTGMKVKYQGPSKYLGKSGDKDVYQLCPDISLLDRDKTVMIMDAKYKEILDSEGKTSVSPSDLYQMVTYSVGYQCHEIVLATRSY